jgi:hypothetical protein
VVCGGGREGWDGGGVRRGWGLDSLLLGCCTGWNDGSRGGGGFRLCGRENVLAGAMGRDGERGTYEDLREWRELCMVRLERLVEPISKVG